MDSTWVENWFQESEFSILPFEFRVNVRLMKMNNTVFADVLLKPLL